MSTSYEIIFGISLLLFPLIIPSKFNKFFFFTAFLFLFSSIFFLDISSYTSDLDRYSDPFHPFQKFYNYDQFKDFLFYKISDLLYKFSNDGKNIIFFWQLIIFINFLISELYIINISKILDIKYTNGIFFFTVFNTVGIQTIYNQLRYGVAFSFLIIITTLLIRYFILRKSKDLSLIIVLTTICFFIHNLVTVIFLLIPVISFLLLYIKKFVNFKYLKLKILNFPVFNLILIFLLSLLLLIFRNSLILIFSSFPLSNNIFIIQAAVDSISEESNLSIFSFLYCFFNIYISYRAIYNTQIKKFIPFMQIITFLSLCSIVFLILPLGSRLTSLMIFLPFPFYLSFNNLKSSYFFKLYYCSIFFINIFRFEVLFPS